MEKMMIRKVIFTTCALALLAKSALAQAIPLVKHSLATKASVEHQVSDPRVKIIAYDPEQVIDVKEHYLVATDYQFGDKEWVRQVWLGDSSSWEAVSLNNHVSVKPKKLNAASNMTVITSDHTYHFMLTVAKAPVDSMEQVVLVKMIYPQENAAKTRANQQLLSLLSPPKNICHDKAHYNLHYSFTGDKEQAPIETCDDGTFTYLKFSRTSDLPAIFSVDAKRHESVVNYRMEGNYVVLEKVAKELTLRNGNTVTNVYNDEALGDWSTVRSNHL